MGAVYCRKVLDSFIIAGPCNALAPLYFKASLALWSWVAMETGTARQYFPLSMRISRSTPSQFARSWAAQIRQTATAMSKENMVGSNLDMSGQQLTGRFGNPLFHIIFQLPVSKWIPMEQCDMISGVQPVTLEPSTRLARGKRTKIFFVERMRSHSFMSEVALMPRVRTSALRFLRFPVAWWNSLVGFQTLVLCRACEPGERTFSAEESKKWSS